MRIQEKQTKPFRYSVVTEVFSRPTADCLLEFLETTTQWKLTRKSFYEQYELSLNDTPLPSRANLLEGPELLKILETMRTIFDIEFEERVELVAHKMLPGQGIGIHNDSVPGWETHRLTVTMNREFRDENGGHLVFFNSFDGADVHRVFRPIHNCAVSFELVPNAFHAVSEVTKGTRYSLVYSFWSRSHALR